MHCPSIAAVYVPGCHIARMLDPTTGEEVPYESATPPLVEHVRDTSCPWWRRGDVIVWDDRCTLDTARPEPR